MAPPDATRTVTVRHDQGLHARPAEQVARAAMGFQSRVEIVSDNQRVDAKSILNILTLGATQGTTLSLEAFGDDAAAAIEALSELIESNFPVE